MKIPLCILIIILVQTVSAEVIEQRFNFQVKTANVDSVFRALIKLTEEKGGYFTRFSNYSLSLRFPAQTLQDFQVFLEEFAEIEERGFESKNRSTDIAKLNSQIESRKKLLDTYFHLVKNASFAELQSVEREMVTLNAQIERLQGQKRAIENRAALALITISAKYLPPVRPTEDRYSPFTWINSTNLNTLRRNFSP